MKQNSFKILCQTIWCIWIWVLHYFVTAALWSRCATSCWSNSPRTFGATGLLSWIHANTVNSIEKRPKSPSFGGLNKSKLQSTVWSTRVSTGYASIERKIYRANISKSLIYVDFENDTFFTLYLYFISFSVASQSGYSDNRKEFGGLKGRSCWARPWSETFCRSNRCVVF